MEQNKPQLKKGKKLNLQAACDTVLDYDWPTSSWWKPPETDAMVCM